MALALAPRSSLPLPHPRCMAARRKVHGRRTKEREGRISAGPVGTGARSVAAVTVASSRPPCRACRPAPPPSRPAGHPAAPAGPAEQSAAPRRPDPPRREEASRSYCRASRAPPSWSAIASLRHGRRRGGRSAGSRRVPSVPPASSHLPPLCWAKSGGRIMKIMKSNPTDIPNSLLFLSLVSILLCPFPSFAPSSKSWAAMAPPPSTAIGDGSFWREGGGNTRIHTRQPSDQQVASAAAAFGRGRRGASSSPRAPSSTRPPAMTWAWSSAQATCAPFLPLLASQVASCELERERSGSTGGAQSKRWGGAELLAGAGVVRGTGRGRRSLAAQDSTGGARGAARDGGGGGGGGARRRLGTARVGAALAGSLGQRRRRSGRPWTAVAGAMLDGALGASPRRPSSSPAAIPTRDGAGAEEASRGRPRQLLCLGRTDMAGHVGGRTRSKGFWTSVTHLNRLGDRICIFGIREPT
ncbi:hypothetical protein PVAP13_1KG458340 [Panicum virgatum]|uniref:Uncharacterized protein n=1 Tax=Panicum virgatum TaxID=38727 RepID=A0A8T0XR83_PANVG|nr:hypothetical protein PVAP13_1KG458340 [Panicum virgatum]